VPEEDESMTFIEIEPSGSVAHVWLNRPQKHNALSAEVVVELTAAFEALGRDSAVRVVVLGGRGPSFCVGADLAGMRALAEAPYEQRVADSELLARSFAAVAECPKPVIGRIHGHVLGGGLGLACACDLAVAAEETRFGFAEVRVGILPAVISPYVLRRIGDRHTRELMLTGERFGADVAQSIGLVQHVVPAAEVDAKVRERAGELLAGGPEAQRRIKALLGRWHAIGWEEYRADLPRVLAEVRAGDEAREGLAAFLEKRRPRWQE
jgi:methylglutaconyl-CoA hydratase